MSNMNRMMTMFKIAAMHQLDDTGITMQRIRIVYIVRV